MSSPLVSIIIPLYNRKNLVRETLDSVLAQTYPHWECIIVDDRSTDDSVHVVSEYAARDARFKIFERHREPKGAPTCRNIGMEKAEGAYVIFLDSDDLLAEFCLERRVQNFSKNDRCDFLVFQSVLFKKSINDAKFYWNIETHESDLQRFLRTEPLWPISGAIYKKPFIEKRNGFKEGIPFLQDTELGMRLLLQKPIYKKFLNEKPDLYIRESPASLSRRATPVETREIIKTRLNILFSVMKFIEAKGLFITREEKNTLWNVCYFFSRHLLVPFASHSCFRKYWLDSNQHLKKGMIGFIPGYFYQYLIYARRFSIYSIKARNIFYKTFNRLIPELREMEKCKLHVTPISETVFKAN